ncbi:hypothetical protein ACNPK3_20380 [Shewanella algae]|uniref:hypothetical protein n=1 Tax=Shewanella algae TaxID=38313 RepID=UPI003AAE9FC3
MIIDWIIYGLLIWGLASLLNNTAFKNTPASKLAAWSLTIVIFLVSVVALSVAKYIRYQMMSDEIGVSINPSNPLDMGGAFVFSWLFYGFLNKAQKTANEDKNNP